MKKTVAAIITEKILNRMSEIERSIENGDADATSFRWVKPFAHGGLAERIAMKHSRHIVV